MSLPKVLIVEDNETIRGLYKIYLGHKNFEVIEAENGEKALSECLFHNFNFALVIVDFHMPLLTGIDVVKFIRQKSLAWHARLPIVLISAYLTPALRAEAKAAGVTAFLDKPVRFAELLNLLRELLPDHTI